MQTELDAIDNVEDSDSETVRGKRRIPDLMHMEMARKLEHEIISGTYAPGTRLIEEDIAARFGVSRSPVRETFRKLEAEGLVTRAARRGVRVTPLSVTDLDEIYSCRLELNGLAAEQASEADPAERAGLWRPYQNMKEAHATGDIGLYFEANLELTAALHGLTGNKVLIRLLHGLTKQSLRYRYFLYRRFPEMMDFSLSKNYDLVDAIVHGHAGMAREVMRLLVRHSWIKIRQDMLLNPRSSDKA